MDKSKAPKKVLCWRLAVRYKNHRWLASGTKILTKNKMDNSLISEYVYSPFHFPSIGGNKMVKEVKE